MQGRYNLNPYVAIPLIAFFINIVITTFVFAQNHRMPVNRAFIWLSLLFSLWMGFDVVIWSPIEPQWIVPLMKAHAVVYNFIGFVFVNFAYTFISRSRDAAYYFFAGVPVIALIVITTTNQIVAGFNPAFWGNAIVSGPWYLPFATINGVIPVSYAVALLVRNMRYEKSAFERKRLSLFLTGTVIGLVTGFSSFVLLPHGFGIDTLPVHSLGLIAFLVCVYIAITRYRFLSVSIGDAASELFSNTRHGVVILSMNNRVVQFNQAAQDLLISEPEETVGDKIREYFLISRKQDREEDVVMIVLKNKGKKYVSVTRSSIKHANQKIGTLLFFSDITAQKSTEELIIASNRELGDARDQALQANRTKSAFLANMSHELRTPLNAIIGYSELLREEAILGNQTDSIPDLSRIHNAGHHLLALINDILDLSKIDAGKMELFADNFSISRVVTEIETMMREKTKANGNIMIVHCPPDIGNMVTDRMRLLQVLNNLLSNALKFTEAGKVTLDVYREYKGSQVNIIFKVTDTGIGIDEEQQKNLFQYFTQADPSATRKHGGSGLGLALSRKFIRMMGGDIRAKSEPGKGSEFTARFPAEFTRLLKNEEQISGQLSLDVGASDEGKPVLE